MVSTIWKQQILLNNENKYYYENAEKTRILQVNILDVHINSPATNKYEIQNLCCFVTFKRDFVSKERRLFVFVKSLM